MLFGLNYTEDQQSTLTQVVQDLVDHNFNAIRLPLAVNGILGNATPNVEYFVNATANPSLNVSDYLDFVAAVVDELGVHQIGVLFDFHQLEHDGNRHGSEEEVSV